MKLHVRGVKERRQRAYDRLKLQLKAAHKEANELHKEAHSKHVSKDDAPVYVTIGLRIARMERELETLKTRGCI